MAEPALSSGEPQSWRVIVDPLLQLEQRARGATGLLACGDPSLPAGGIFVDDSRICWIAARGLKRRLTDILSHEIHLSDGELRGLYDRCRLEGRPIGQALVGMGMISESHLRRVLRQHSAESLVQLAHEGSGWHWLPRAHRGYDPQFTFSPDELLLEIAGLWHGTAQADARAELEKFRGPGQHGGAFLRDPSESVYLPLAVYSDEKSLTLNDLMALGAWATQLSAATMQLGESPTVVLGNTVDGKGAAVWWRDGIVFAVRCRDREALARLMTRHLALGA